MPADWKQLAREAGHRVSGDGSVEVSLPGGGRQTLSVDLHERSALLRAWSIVAARSTVAKALADGETPHRYAWTRNRLSDLVGFVIDRRGRLIGETWIPLDGLSADELDVHLHELARICDWHEFRLSGKDDY